jgi:hypothetical protein
MVEYCLIVENLAKGEESATKDGHGHKSEASKRDQIIVKIWQAASCNSGIKTF